MAITPVFAAGGDADIFLWQTLDGVTAISSVAGQGVDGGRAFDINLSAAKGQIFTPGSFGGTILVAQFRFKLVTLPAANALSVSGMYPGGTNGEMGWTQSTGVLNIGLPGLITQGTTVLVAGTWYTIDQRWNTVANPWVIDWAVNGIAQPQAKPATAADTVSNFAIGTNAGAGVNETYHAQYDHIVVSVTSADFPMAPMNVQPWTVQTVTGTHNQTAGDLQTDASVNVTNGDSTGSKLTELPADTTSFIKQTAIRSTTYYEALYGAGAATVAPQGVQQSTATSLVSGTTGTEKSQLFDGTTASDMYAVSSPGGTALLWHTKMWASPPSGGAWTASQLNAARLRWGFAGNVTGNPFVSFSILEAIFAESSGAAPILPDFLSPLRRFGRPSPLSTVGGPTTWNVTLTESVQSSDAWIRAGTFNRTDTEGVTSGDSWSRAGTFLRTLTESVQSSDAWTRLGTWGRTLTESVQSADVWTRAGAFLRGWTESVQSADTWVGLKVVLRTMTESVTSSDAWMRTGTFLRSTTESVQSGDVWTRLATFGRSLTESVQSADVWTRLGTWRRSLTESVTSADVWTGVKVILRSWSESVASSDVWTRSGGFARSTAESVTSSDVWTRAATFRRAMAEAVSSFDTWVAAKLGAGVIGGIGRGIAYAVHALAGGNASQAKPGSSATQAGPGSSATQAKPGAAAEHSVPGED